jgi:Lrp/AsnC family transcriptional regulator for asnA, asnC and gidA
MERDKKILKLLQEDARISYKDIAEKTNIPASTVHFRVKKMQKEGIIKNFSINIDLEKLGYDAIAWVGLTVDPIQISEISNKIANLEEVLKIFSTTGDHNLVLQIVAKNEKSLWRFLRNKIQTIKGVSPQMHVSITLDIYKWNNSMKL